MLSKEELICHYAKEGLTKTAIAKTLGINRRTVHRNLSNGKDEPGYRPRPKSPSKLDHYKVYLMGRIETYPELSAQRLFSEVRGTKKIWCFQGHRVFLLCPDWQAKLDSLVTRPV